MVLPGKAVAAPAVLIKRSQDSGHRLEMLSQRIDSTIYQSSTPCSCQLWLLSWSTRIGGAVQ